MSSSLRGFTSGERHRNNVRKRQCGHRSWVNPVKVGKSEWGGDMMFPHGFKIAFITQCDCQRPNV